MNTSSGAQSVEPPGLVSNIDATEPEITLKVLAAVDKNHAVTQRSLAKEVGIALGLANTYLRRCVKKGLIKINAAPANRYAYYLTPQGFAEKSRLTAEFLTQSFKLFRIARNAYTQILADCGQAGRRRIIVIGGSDLTEIIKLCLQETPCTILGFVPNVTAIADLGEFDVILLADLSDPQRTYDLLIEMYGRGKVIAPTFLNISERDGGESDSVQ